MIPLKPVDELSVLTVCDNIMDILLQDQGPAKRLPLLPAEGVATAMGISVPTVISEYLCQGAA